MYNLTVRYCGLIRLAAAAAGVAAVAIGVVDKLHKLFCSWSTFFCSFSFWVSANLTTRGDEQPSIVWEWCIALMALIAHCLVENVTKAQPENLMKYIKNADFLAFEVITLSIALFFHFYPTVWILIWCKFLLPILKFLL